MADSVKTGDGDAENALHVNVDGRDLQARPGELLIDVAERNGIYIPRFCHHSRMKPVGMCRMCLVNVEGPRGAALQPACMLTVAEGMKIDTKAPEVKKAQDGVLEFLLANHPLDCPVCDKGGECPLQDQTMAFGPGETRFVEEKRHFEKPIHISPLVALDRERCILCDRCTRFAKDIAGDPLIHFQSRGNQTYVNVFPDHPFSSYFSGNTVQICPVGALTAIPYRFKARPWDLEAVESTCTSCSFGCRVNVQSSADALTRYVGLDAEPTNHGWMCDKGRFDYEALNSQERLSAPLMKIGGTSEQVEVSWGEALRAAADAIRSVKPESVAVIGGARLANEDQYLWARLAKSVIGTDNVDAQLGDGLPAELVLSLPGATIDEVCAAKTVIVIGPDLKEELPVLFLRLREAIVDHGCKVIEISPHPTSLTKLAASALIYRTGDAAGVVSALTGKGKAAAAGLEQQEVDKAREIIAGDSEIAVIYGRQSLAESEQPICEAVGLLNAKLTARFLPALRRANVVGALGMGLSPGLLPGRVSLDAGKARYKEKWQTVPAKRGLDAKGILQAALANSIDVLILLGADPLSDFPDRTLAAEALAAVKTVISVDVLPNKSVKASHIVLPASGYAERAGTTTNIESRVMPLGQKVTAPGSAWPDWMIAVELASLLGTEFDFEDLNDVAAEITATLPTEQSIDFEASTSVSLPPVDGYGARLMSTRKLYDLGTGVEFSPSLKALVAEKVIMRIHPVTLAPLGVDNGSKVRVRSAKGSLDVVVEVDESMPRGVVLLPFNTSEHGAGDLIDSSVTVTNVRLETL